MRDWSASRFDGRALRPRLIGRRAEPIGRRSPRACPDNESGRRTSAARRGARTGVAVAGAEWPPARNAGTPAQKRTCDDRGDGRRVRGRPRREAVLRSRSRPAGPRDRTRSHGIRPGASLVRRYGHRSGVEVRASGPGRHLIHPNRDPLAMEGVRTRIEDRSLGAPALARCPVRRTTRHSTGAAGISRRHASAVPPSRRPADVHPPSPTPAVPARTAPSPRQPGTTPRSAAPGR